MKELARYIKNKLTELLSEKEVEACMSFFDTDRDGRISLDEFKIWLMSDPENWGPICTGDTLGDFTNSYKATLAGANSEEAKLQAIKMALKRFATAFQDKTHGFYEIFHKHDAKRSGRVNKEQFVQALESARTFQSYVKIDKSYPKLIADYFFPKDCRDLEYKRFIAFLGKQDIPPIR